MADTAATRLVIIPDTDGDMLHDLDQLEEILHQLQPYTDDDEPAAPGFGADELHALQRTASTIRAAEHVPAADIYKPDPPGDKQTNQFQLVALRFVTMPTADLALIGQAINHLGLALSAGDTHVSDTLDTVAGAGQRPVPQAAADLVVRFAQAHGVLDLAGDVDTAFLAETLTARTGRVVLSSEQHQAYERYTQRVLTMNLDSPLDRYLYRGL